MNSDKQRLAKQLGLNIAQYRQQANLTQEQLAERLGIGNEAVSRIERGVVMPSLMRLIEFSDIFRCSLADLVSRKSVRENDESHYIISMLQGLEKEDRDLVVEILEKLVSRLKQEK